LWEGAFRSPLHPSGVQKMHLRARAESFRSPLHPSGVQKDTPADVVKDTPSGVLRVLPAGALGAAPAGATKGLSARPLETFGACVRIRGAVLPLGVQESRPVTPCPSGLTARTHGMPSRTILSSCQGALRPISNNLQAKEKRGNLKCDGENEYRKWIGLSPFSCRTYTIPLQNADMPNHFSCRLGGSTVVIIIA
jgi:hypothetical protein